MMQHDVNRVIKNEIEASEKLLWSGQPHQGLKFFVSDLAVLPFAITWMTFICYWLYGVIFNGDSTDSVVPIAMILFGIPFFLIGIHLLVGRFFLAAKRRQKTFYALSDKRVIIITGIFKQSIKSLNLSTISDISLTRTSNTTGSIAFGHTIPLAAFMNEITVRSLDEQLGPRFDFVQNSKQVYSKIVNAHKNATL